MHRDAAVNKNGHDAGPEHSNRGRICCPANESGEAGNAAADLRQRADARPGDLAEHNDKQRDRECERGANDTQSPISGQSRKNEGEEQNAHKKKKRQKKKKIETEIEIAHTRMICKPAGVESCCGCQQPARSSYALTVTALSSEPTNENTFGNGAPLAETPNKLRCLRMFSILCIHCFHF